MNNIFKINMGAAKCAADLGDGSERGEYVDQDYILRKLGRPHRGISLMYCYYPLDKQWPARISEVMSADAEFQWAYPYEDYFPYLGGLGGSTDGEPFNQMRDIRRHGQDVILTITMDTKLPDEMLAAIGDDLRPFGRLMLRINHEATGNWFPFTRRADSYQEVADFYCRACRVIKEHAPNVRTVLCIGGVEDIRNRDKITMEEEFAQGVRETDIWSVDKYMALHWGWPYDIAEPEGKTHYRCVVHDIYELTKASYERFKVICGGAEKPMVMSEFNSDGDVTGAYEQAEMMKHFCDILDEEQADWLSGLTFYQFRDRGRLGLEIEDPNNPNVGIEQPVLKTYREIINRQRFLPKMTLSEEVSLPAVLRWGGSEDADGIALELHFDGDPVFCEAYFDDDSNLMMELNGMWFYKAPKTKFVDFMPAFYENRLDGAADLTLKIFAPPATGENDLTAEDGLVNYRCTIEKLPKIRILTKPVMESMD